MFNNSLSYGQQHTGMGTHWKPTPACATGIGTPHYAQRYEKFLESKNFRLAFKENHANRDILFSI